MAETPEEPRFSPSSESKDSVEKMIEVHDVCKAYGENEVLKGVSLEVNSGETLGIIGLSGCGKSTLLKIIAQLEDADAGEVHLSDPNYSLVFQYSALFDSLTIFENVAFSLMERPDAEYEKILLRRRRTKRRYSNEQLQEIVTEKLRMVGLEGIESQYPNELSGGMRKRVSFARAIVSNPKIILYDEPTAGLDPIASTVIEDYIMKLRDELGAASVVVTHQFSTINRTDRLILLHEGQIRWEGTPKELYETDNPYAKQFAHASLEGPMALEAV